MSIKSLLIANRGEIALRIIHTARAMGIKSIAIYSDADRKAPHVSEADSAFHIGPSEAVLSYLNAKRIIETAVTAGADAVHPGYGFLSENASFAADCVAAGLCFVGPSAELIRTMGSKVEAKKLAIAAGVPVLPGYYGKDQSDETFCDQAKKTGFPVLVKASSGGGGRGMRVVLQASDLPSALVAARSEAKAGFGDPTLLLERYVEKARHIEVQVLGDAHGNVVHLFERDCSLQRNHQKVIEEAPAPDLSEPLRKAILKSAITLASAVAYQNAGTVEYLLDENTGEFFFLEMNTRLQVEHPVTEAVTGIDLVDCQLRVAAGEPLSFRQEDINCIGWAVEARVAAEDPTNDYRPETGVITDFMAAANCRTDSGVEAGSVVSHHYDSMLAKVIAHAQDRASAISQLTSGLAKMRIGGITTNLGFIADLLCSDPFVEGSHNTGTIVALHQDGWHPRAATAEMRSIAVLARYLADCTKEKSPWHGLGAWRSTKIGGRCGMAIYHLEKKPAELLETCNGITVNLINEKPQVFAHINSTPDRLIFEHEGQRHNVYISFKGTEVQIFSELGIACICVENGEEAFLGHLRNAVNEAHEIRAPMPGLVAEVLKDAGTQVNAGDPIIIIEAMKLLQTLVAPCDGELSAVHFRTGDAVDKHVLLATFIPEETLK
jgi:acetyl/propionyl-CoA carboxylase alpha subunit